MAPVAAAFVFAGSCVVVVAVYVADIAVVGSGDAAEGTLGAATVVEVAVVAVVAAADGWDVTVAISVAVFGTDIAVVAVDVIVGCAAANVLVLLVEHARFVY